MGILTPFKKGKVDQKGIFVVGAARSGTTLLRLLINNHPDIACLGETQFFHHNYLQLSNNQKRNLNLFDRIFNTESELPDFLNNPQLITGLENKNTVAEYFDYLLSSYSNKLGKKQWAEKSPSHILRINSIIELFPDAKIINIKRNPYSSAISRFNKLKHFGITNISLFFYLQYLKRIDRIVRDFSKNSPDSILTISYEDLADNTLNVMSAIFDFLPVNNLSVLDDSFLNISPKNIPKNEKGETQKHHSKVVEDIKNSNYNPKEFLSVFQLFLFNTELQESVMYGEYISINTKINISFKIRLILLKIWYFIFGIPKYKLRRFSNQIKSRIKSL